MVYACLAGLSPLALLSSLAVLGSRRARLNGSAYAFGFLLAQGVALLVVVLIGSAAAADGESHESIVLALELAAGLGLLAAAFRMRVTGRQTGAEEESRLEALLRRLRGLRPLTTFAMGAALGVGGLKRLTITVLAGTSIAVDSLLRSEKFALGVLYTAIAGLLVWIPVGLYLVAGSRSDRWNEGAGSWIVAHERAVTMVSMLAFGGVLVLHSVLRLV